MADRDRIELTLIEELEKTDVFDSEEFSKKFDFDHSVCHFN